MLCDVIKFINLLLPVSYIYMAHIAISRKLTPVARVQMYNDS
jgi:hypothetical protein